MESEILVIRSRCVFISPRKYDTKRRPDKRRGICRTRDVVVEDLEQRIYVERIKSLTKNNSGAMTGRQSMLLFFIIRMRACASRLGGNTRAKKKTYKQTSTCKTRR